MTAKKYLMQYRHIDARIDAKLEQIARLRAIAQGTGTQGGASSSSPGDRVGSLTVKIVDLEREVNEEIDKLYDLRRDILGRINRIGDERLRTLLELKYINGYTLEQIAIKMHYGYKQICRLHGKALHELAETTLAEALGCP